MSRKIILCVLLILFASGDIANGKVRKSAKRTAKTTTVIQENEKEIDNFDFLYEGSDDLNVEYDNMAINGLLDEAMSHIGARYRSGSKGPYAFDCSGFTSYVFRQLGAGNIGASSRDQYARNMPVSRSEMQRGDLVFFTSPNSGHNVGHVGIVVDVDPVTLEFTFIHASSKNGVKLSSSTEPNYAKRYVGARRISELSAL